MGRFTNPRDLYFGEGARHEVKNLKGSKAIIVSGGGSMRRGGFLQDVEADLKEAGFEVKLFEGVESDPSVETVMKGAEAMREFEPDWIVAIGGGSPIDAAKAMWLFYEYPEETFEQAVTRRCRFELGVEISDIAPVHPAFRYRAVAPNGIVENEVCPVYAARVVREVQPNDDEVMDYQWVDLATMLSALAATPWAFSPLMVLEAENRDARQALTDFVARMRG